MAATATMPSPPGLATDPPAPTRTRAVLAWLGLAFLLLARAYRVFLLTLLATAAVPMLWSWSSYVIVSGSMEPALSVGDVVVAKPFTSESEVPVGRVMIFTPPGAAEGDDTRAHRVVENLGQNSYTTAGDANRSTDPEPVPAENFRAQPVLCVPFIALPLIWARGGDFLLLGLFLAITTAALYFSSRPPCTPRHRHSERSRARRAMRRGLVPLAATVTVVGVAVSGLPTFADAAFSATASNRESTWNVAATFARVTLDPPGVTVRGTVDLTAVMANTAGRTYSVRIEYAAAGSAAWHNVCTKASAPYTCSWATTSVTNGSYDLRAVATSGSTTIPSAIASTIVDNTSPTAPTVERQLTSDQPTSYCAQVQVTNSRSTPVEWEATLDMAAAPYTSASITSSSNVTTVAFVPSTSWTVRGVGWNSTLAPGASTQFQYCAQRPDGVLTDATTTVSVTSSNATSYCAEVTVSTTSTQWVRWRATIGRTTPGLTPVQWLDAQPTNSWNAKAIGFNATTQSWVTQGGGWNDYIKAGQPQTWGYCSPYSQNAPLTDADASVTVTSQSGSGSNTQYCATTTVSTTSTQWVRWRATIGSSTPGLSGLQYRLTSAPQPTGAVPGSFSSSGNNWSWTLTGTSNNTFIKAGSPANWSYCKQ